MCKISLPGICFRSLRNQAGPFIVLSLSWELGVATTMTTQVSNWSVGLFCGIVLSWHCDIVVLNYQVFIVGVLLWH